MAFRETEMKNTMIAVAVLSVASSLLALPAAADRSRERSGTVTTQRGTAEGTRVVTRADGTRTATTQVTGAEGRTRSVVTEVTGTGEGSAEGTRTVTGANGETRTQTVTVTGSRRTGQ
jgi:hypothetical protein